MKEDWEVLRYVHKIGGRIDGTVIKILHDKHWIILQTDSIYRAILPFSSLYDGFILQDEDGREISPENLPSVGDTISTVVSNFNHEILWLSKSPSALSAEKLQKYQLYYSHYWSSEVLYCIEMFRLNSETT